MTHPSPIVTFEPIFVSSSIIHGYNAQFSPIVTFLPILILEATVIGVEIDENMTVPSPTDEK